MDSRTWALVDLCSGARVWVWGDMYQLVCTSLLTLHGPVIAGVKAPQLNQHRLAAELPVIQPSCHCQAGGPWGLRSVSLLVSASGLELP